MREYGQLLIFVIIGAFLLWFGYTLLMGQWAKLRPNLKQKQPEKRPERGTATPGDPQVCPICSMPLDRGELVKTLVYPSITGGKDRLMHIQGCYYCLNDNYERFCPVCGKFLNESEFLVARMFERPLRHPHIHVLGCSKCRPLRVM